MMKIPSAYVLVCMACRDDGFPESCVYPLIQMQYDAGTGAFSNAPGVQTSVYNFGSPDCSPFLYNDLTTVAEAVGYTAGQLAL